MPRKKKMPDIEEILTAMENSTGRERQRMLTKLSRLMNADSRVQKVFSTDLDQHILEATSSVSCPNCGSTIIKKNGFRRNGLQDYRCLDCHKHFTLVSKTLLDKTKYPWGVWVEVLRQMLLKQSTQTTVRILESDFGIEGINEKTVYNMRMKILHASKYVEKPILSDVVECDETSVHEGQKHSAVLIDPLNPTGTRTARKRWKASQYGALGPEFGTLLCAVDHSGHVIAYFSGVGATTAEDFEKMIHPHLQNVHFLCSDANSIYSHYCDKYQINHYIKPSYTDKTIQKAKENKTSISLLYRSGMIDSIEGSGYHDLSYEEFKDLKKQNRLGLSYVNGFHSRLKENIVIRKHGISLKNLGYYVSWQVLIENWRIDYGHDPISYEDAEEILKQLVNTHENITQEDIAERKPDFTTLDQRFQERLIKKTQAVKDKRKAKQVYLTSEDLSKEENLKYYLEQLPVYQLRFLGKYLSIPGYTKAKKGETYLLRSQLVRHPNIRDAIDTLIAEYGRNQEI